MTSDSHQIRLLNDQLRQNLKTGRALITPGIAALGTDAVNRIVQTIAIFDDFCHATDPHEEHTTLARSTSTAKRSCSRSTTTIKASSRIRQTQRTQLRLSASLRSCSLRSIKALTRLAEPRAI